MAPRGIIKTPPAKKAPAPQKPKEFVMAAPRIKPTQTRNYGKGLSTLSSNMNPTAYGAGVGYGGDDGGS